MNGLIIAAPRSGSGKTVVTLGLLRALRQRGLRVAAAKVGPDYIDPGYLAAACGGACANLDAWAMRRATIAAELGARAAEAELLLCEGAMGLHDGAGAESAGSTAALAALTGWPVILVLDLAGQAQSAAALVEGFARHRSDVTIAGVILNRVGGERHAALAAAALARAVPAITQLGALPRDAALELPSRHLGLIPAGEHARLDAFLDEAAARIGASVDLDAVVALARVSSLRDDAAGPVLPPLGQCIAVARDAAFAFAYPSVLRGWRDAGAAVAFFAPLADEAPPAACDAVYLPGGYPELHAARLAANRRFIAGLRAAAQSGATLYGECGGYMVLGRQLIDCDGASHEMAGLLPLATSFAARKLHLGYRAVSLAQDTPLGACGARFRGHEFHYASITDEGEGAPLFRVADADGAALAEAGRVNGKVMGSFVHLIDRAEP
ncbi:MAG: cobyrinate a,c-diamide synthase [Stellaceae bacterium]